MTRTTSLHPSTLAPAGKLSPSAIERARFDAAGFEDALGEAKSGAEQAAVSIAAALSGLQAAIPQLLPLLDDDALAGRAAAWSLGKIGGAAVLTTLLEEVGKAAVVRRENVYAALATLASVHGVPAGLADAMAARVEAENERAKSGRTGLGERALRVLAVAGDARVEELGKRIIEADRFSNRVEIDRLRKAVASNGRDVETIKQLSGAWTVPFEDALEPPPEPEKGAEAGPVVDVKPGAAPVKGPAAAAPPQPAPAAAAPVAEEPGAPVEAGAPKGIDWAAFETSPELAKIPGGSKSQLVGVCKFLEQIAAQALGLPLDQLEGEELLALLLDVVPRGLPPQQAQVVLSPPAVAAYEALFAFLVRRGEAPNGAQLVQAMQQVKQLQAQAAYENLPPPPGRPPRS